MKSITTKLSVAMISCMLVAVTLVSAIQTSKTLAINEEASRTMIKLLCDDQAKALDEQLVAIQRSTDLLAQYASFFLNEDRLPLLDRINNLKEASLQTAQYTEETYAVYFHFSPEQYDSDMDFFFVRNLDTNAFKEEPAHNPYAYQREFGKPADWYFASAKSQQACWLKPYTYATDSTGEELVIASYTVPVYSETGELLGVLGMDYSLEELDSAVRAIRLYDSGYAFLVTAEGTIISHPHISFGTKMSEVNEELNSVQDLLAKGEPPKDLFRYPYSGEEKQLTFTVLRNGIYLGVTAPSREINALVRQMVSESQILFAVVMISSVVIVYCIIYRFIHPLQRLTYASQQIIKGNMQVKLPYHAPDEIGELTENFRQMTSFLQEHISRINTMAYTDAMTGLKNKASYQSATHLLGERIQQGFYDFAVVVFDLNDLKHINDTLGHEAGDHLIQNAGRIIGRAFSHSPVFRIGGDEFVAILENDDFNDLEGCLERLENITVELNKKLEKEERVSLAYGLARFETGTDEDYHDVFTRADKEMYRHKLQYKASQTYSADKGEETCQL